MSQTTITDIGTVGIPVSDQDKAVEFFTGTLGFEKRLDARMGESFRWVTVAAPGASTSVALIARPDTGADTGIRFLVPRRRNRARRHAAAGHRGRGPAPVAGCPAHVRVQGPRREQVRDRRSQRLSRQKRGVDVAGPVGELDQ
jgi:catechol 2,3-dioxygenase-like lactoylglutathione lyase family enzyme